jgi:hypothetical protein
MYPEGKLERERKLTGSTSSKRARRSILKMTNAGVRDGEKIRLVDSR